MQLLKKKKYAFDYFGIHDKIGRINIKKEKNFLTGIQYNNSTEEIFILSPVTYDVVEIKENSKNILLSSLTSDITKVENRMQTNLTLKATQSEKQNFNGECSSNKKQGLW